MKIPQDEQDLRDIADIPLCDDVYIGMNDLQAFVHTPGEGFSYSLYYTHTALQEDDAMQMVGHEETMLSNEEHVEIINESCRSIIEEIGCYINPNVMRRLFPGLDVNNIGEYDFYLNSRISIVILPYYSYQHFVESQDRGVDVLHNQAYQTGNVKVWDQPRESADGPYKPVNLSKRALVVMSEVLPTTNFDRIIQSEVVTEEMRKATHKRIILARIIHELLHAMEIQEEHSSELFQESVVEYFSALIHSKSYSGLDVNLGYPTGVVALNALMSIALEIGLSDDLLKKAILASDSVAIGKVYQAFTKAFDDEVACRIIEYDFGDADEAYRFIRELDTSNTVGSNSIV